MPSLKQLSCSVELGSTNTKLTEYGTNYGDGHVTSYIAVPTEEVNFSVHLTSSGYIASGLAMFVYMDGQYQCNRNRRGLVVPGRRVSPEYYEVDLRVRQKETKQPDGSFLGRDWTFHGLNLVSADKVEDTNNTFLENMGTIEVIVLRCKDAPQLPPSIPSGNTAHHISPHQKHVSTPAREVQREPSKTLATEPKVNCRTPSAKAKSAEKPPSKSKSDKSEGPGAIFGGMFDGPADESAGIQPKSYWADWNKRPTSSPKVIRTPLYIAPEEPLPQVPVSAARKQDLEHQVKMGKGATYVHLCSLPEYLDDMKQPYAVFTFKYRSKKVIEKMFKIQIREQGQSLKAKLADMSKDELAEELFKLKMANTPSSTTKSTQVSSKPKIIQPPKAASVKPASHKSSKKGETASQTWDQPAQAGTNWAAQDNTTAGANWNDDSNQQSAQSADAWNNDSNQQPAQSDEAWNTNSNQQSANDDNSWDDTPAQGSTSWPETPKQEPTTAQSNNDWDAPAQENTDWDAPAQETTDWNTPDPAKQNKAPSHTGSRKSASKGKSSMPGTYPKSTSGNTSRQASGGASHSGSQAKAASTHGSKKSSSKAKSGGGGDWATSNDQTNNWDNNNNTSGGDWNNNDNNATIDWNQDNAAGNGGHATAGAADESWNTTANDKKGGKDSVKWHTIFTVIRLSLALALLLGTYFYIRGYVLWLLSCYRSFKDQVYGSVAWASMLYSSVVDWFVGLKSGIVGLVKIPDLSGFKVPMPRMPQIHFSMPHLSMPGWESVQRIRAWVPWSSWDAVPAVWQDGFEDVVEETAAEVGSSFI